MSILLAENRFLQVMELKIQRKNPGSALKNRNPWFFKTYGSLQIQRTVQQRPDPLKLEPGQIESRVHGPGFTIPVP
jgi:hypothetical protein